MGASPDEVRDDLAGMGPTLFVQEYRRRGWQDGEMAGVMAGAGVSAGKIREVLAHGKEQIELAKMGPTRFVQEYRRLGWRDGDLAGIMAGEGVSAGKIHQALSQGRRESTAGRARRAAGKAGQYVAGKVQAARKLGTPASPLRTSLRHMTRDYRAQREQAIRETDLPLNEQERLAQGRLAESRRQPPIPMGRRPSAAEQARIVAEQGMWGITQGGIAAAYDWMIAMNTLRAPAVRREIAYLQQFPPDSPERRRAEELKWDLPETWEVLKQEALGKLGQAADSGLPADLALGSGRLYAQMARGLGQWSGRWLTGKASAPLLMPERMASQSLAKGLLRAPWMQPALKEAARRYPGGDRILATVLSGLPVDVAKQIVAGENDPDRVFEKAKAELARRAVSGLGSAGGQDAADEAVAGWQPEQ